MNDPLLRVRTLGAFEVRDRHGRAVIAADDPARHLLLKFLIGTPGLRAERRSIGAYLWENRGTRSSNLRFAAHALHRLLERYNADEVVIDEGRHTVLALNPAAVEVDALVFEQRLAEAECDASDAERWIAAIDAYHGTYLPDDEMPWLIGRRSILRLGILHAVTRARASAFDASARADVEDAVDRLRAVAADDRFLMEELAAGEEPIAPYVTIDSELIGREHQLERARSVIDRAFAGYATLVAIVGTPGVGATALARAITIEAVARDARAAWIDGSEPATFSRVRRALESLASIADSTSHDVVSAYGAAIARDTDIAPLAAAKLVLGLAARTPIAIVVDDAEYADAATRAFIAQLKSRLSNERLVVVLTADTGARSDALLAPFFRDPLRSPELFELDPLPANIARHLIPRFGLEAVARSGGHPGYAAVFAAGQTALTAYEARVRRWLGSEDALAVLDALLNGEPSYEALSHRFPEYGETRLTNALENLERVGAIARTGEGYDVVDPIVYELFARTQQS